MLGATDSKNVVAPFEMVKMDEREYIFSIFRVSMSKTLSRLCRLKGISWHGSLVMSGRVGSCWRAVGEDIC